MTEPNTKTPPSLVRAADRANTPEHSFSHPLNPSSEIHMRSLSDPAGLKRVGLHVLRIPPGKESFVYHSHYTEEEFVYILSGRGVAEIDGEEYEVGPGDFMGFSTPSVAHHLKNPFPEDLVYLSGGERRDAEIADFPRHGQRLVRVGMSVAIHGIDDAKGFPGMPRLGEKK